MQVNRAFFAKSGTICRDVAVYGAIWLVIKWPNPHLAMMTPQVLKSGALKFGLKALIRAYQLSFSAIFGRTCRFLPSCSEYAMEAIEVHGAWRGTGLAARRFCRCHPVKFLGGSSGYDPVPPLASSTLPASSSFECPQNLDKSAGRAIKPELSDN